MLQCFDASMLRCYNALYGSWRNLVEMLLAFSFWLLAIGFWHLAFGTWLLTNSQKPKANSHQ